VGTTVRDLLLRTHLPAGETSTHHCAISRATTKTKGIFARLTQSKAYAPQVRAVLRARKKLLRVVKEPALVCDAEGVRNSPP